MGFLKGNSLPKLVVTCDFITQSGPLGVEPSKPPVGGGASSPERWSALAFRWDAYRQLLIYL
ncbi:MAG: hypothetical protein EWV76_04885 [Microcystis novacekii Mn_MB_F_20050700_S1]|uniref:Uncharacterized protein n=1 Tax=Microcystis novacekii Mn_MB_F_20050700_S1D TaxID=2486266 RepID=A0A552IFL9_9CHRO|nr:MAG: hypothetical protein EWV54_22035 [Microcystis novacekii Mn_MB_F_20050700_S1D]TRU90834.1 MAG: hypothetical protein EWV76_04885 [Microcystis novacekii Mn_MB_F_20050700_S1]